MEKHPDDKLDLAPAKSGSPPLTSDTVSNLQSAGSPVLSAQAAPQEKEWSKMTPFEESPEIKL